MNRILLGSVAAAAILAVAAFVPAPARAEMKMSPGGIANSHPAEASSARRHRHVHRAWPRYRYGYYPPYYRYRYYPYYRPYPYAAMPFPFFPFAFGW